MPRKTTRRNKIIRSAKDAWENARDQAGDFREQGEDLVRKYPLTSIALAAGVGALVGLSVALLAGRRERSFWDRFSDYW